MGKSSPGDQKDRKLKGEKEERRGNTRNISPRLAFLQNTASEIFCSFLDVVPRILLTGGHLVTRCEWSRGNPAPGLSQALSLQFLQAHQWLVFKVQRLQ